jgi:hypothetical protein
MKDRSLFHLLMARLSQLSRDEPAGAPSLARDLQQTLQIEQNGDWFLVKWHWQGKPYDLGIPGDTFHFYVRGDTGKEPARRDLRTENWRQAEAALRHIAQISGAHLPQDRRPGLLSRSGAPEVEDPISPARVIAPGAIAGLAALAVSGPEIAISTAMVAVALCYLNEIRRYTFLQRPVHWRDAGVIAAGALVPALLGVSPDAPGLLALALALFTRAELAGTRATSVDWLVPGAVAGSLVLVLGLPGWIPVLELIAAILLIHLALPNRLALAPALAGATAAGVSGAIAALFPVLSADQTASMVVAAPAFAWAIVGMFAFCFSLGWIFGQQTLLLPWLGFAVIGSTCLAVLVSGSSASRTVSFMAFSGYGVCMCAELLRAPWQRRGGQL